MTPLEIEEAARRKYNAVGDTFWSSDEIMNLIFDACMQLAEQVQCIEAVYTTSTVASQRQYNYPTYTLSIKRITYDGTPLLPIPFTEDDEITGLNEDTSDTGTPQYYSVWNETIYLRPVPSAVGTLRILSYNEPQEVTSTSTLEVPTVFHPGIVDFVVSEMFAKDSNANMATYHLNRWDKRVERGKRLYKRRLRGDRMAAVKDEDESFTTILGPI